MFDKPLVIVDVETTGGSPFFHRVIEIGVLRVEHGEVVETFETLLNPGRPIPEFITGLTGISDQDVRHAPTFEDVKEDLIEIFRDAVFVAHNSSFDYHFLKEEFERNGYGFNMDSLCTVRLSRRLFPKYKRHNLDSIIDRFDIECANRHRALGDAQAVWDFLQLLPDKFDTEEISEAFSGILKTLTPKSKLTEPIYVFEE